MDNWQFWLIAAAVTLAVAAVLLRAMARAGEDLRAAAEFDIKVYKDQLTEIERDLTRGTLPPEEADRQRAEVSRRLLEADRAAQAGNAPVRRGGVPIAAAVVAVILAGAFLAYDRLGAPGYPDLPLSLRLQMSENLRAARPDQATAEAQAPKPEAQPVDPAFADLIDKLRAAVAARPTDVKGLELLASNEARLGNLPAARKAMEQLVSAKGDQATAEDHAALAEVMIMAAAGAVTPEAEQALTRALAIDPDNGTARFYSGVLMAQIGRYDMTFRLWAPLLDKGPQDAPWIAPIRAQIEDIAFRAGEKYTLPEAAMPGPDAGAVAAAAEMTPEERQAMIEGMVAQLDTRLQDEGGSPEEWARLVNALVQLDRMPDAQAAYDRSKVALKGDTVGTSALRELAVTSGLTP
jgi:cytochrome c-type biogenesis protein CcmH